MLYPRRHNHYIACFHSRTFAADLCGELSCNKENHLFALVVSLRLFPRGLPLSELHDRGLASRRGLQDFEPFRHSMDILTFHDTIGRLKLAFFTLFGGARGINPSCKFHVGNLDRCYGLAGRRQLLFGFFENSPLTTPSNFWRLVVYRDRFDYWLVAA